MREPAHRDRIIQALLALLCVLPLMIAFWGGGGFSDAFGNPTNAATETLSRKLALLEASGRSLQIGLTTTLLALLLGIPGAWALAQSERPLWLLVIGALPLALPASVVVSGWISIFAPDVASSFASSTVNLSTDREFLFTPWGASFVLATSLWPIVAFELWPGFRRVRNESYDAAVQYGSRLRAFLKIALPQCKGEMSSAAMLVFLLAASDFSVSSLLLVKTLPTEIDDALKSGKAASAAWASLPLLVLAGVVALALSRFQRVHTTTSAQSPAPRKHSLVAAAGFSVCVFIGFFVPMLACLYSALSGKHAMSTVFGAGVDALWVSLRLAGGAALISLLIAEARLVFWPDVRTWSLNTAGLFMLAIPGSFLAASLLMLQVDVLPSLETIFSKKALSTLPAVLLSLGYVARFVYIPLRLIEEGLSSLDPDLLDAAALAGHGRFSRAVSIALPLVAPHIAAATALVFILSLGEVAMADRLAPPGAEPATVWLFRQQHMGYDESVFGLSLLLGCVTALVLVIAGICAMWLRSLFRIGARGVL